MRIELIVRLLGVLIAFFTPPVLAQDKCGDVLSVAYDTIDTEFNSSSYKSAKYQACSSQKSVSNINGSLIYEGLDVGLGLSKDEADAWCSNSFSVEAVEQRFRQRVSTVHDSVIAAWKECMGNPGAHSALTPSSDPAVLFLTLSYVSSNPRVPEAHLDAIELKNLKCEGLPKPGEEFVGRSVYLCERDPAKTSQAVVRFKDAIAPNPVELRAMLPNNFEPKYNLTGVFKSRGLGGVVINQSGRDIAWAYKERAISHTFIGMYYTSVDAIGLQMRLDEASGCSVKMVIKVTALNNSSYCHTSRLEPKDKPQCEFPANWSEQWCYSQKM